MDDGGLAAKLSHLLVLLAGAGEAGLESFDFAEPAAFGGFPDAVVQVGDDLGEALGLGRVRPQHGTA